MNVSYGIYASACECCFLQYLSEKIYEYYRHDHQQAKHKEI